MTKQDVLHLIYADPSRRKSTIFMSERDFMELVRDCGFNPDPENPPQLPAQCFGLDIQFTDQPPYVQ